MGMLGQVVMDRWRSRRLNCKKLGKAKPDTGQIGLLIG
jgi:hypothetical protein